MTRAKRVAAFPPRILEDRNPYARLFYRELDRLGFKTSDASRFDLGWLWSARRSVGILHFHWDPQQRYVKREPDAVTTMLESIDQKSLVPWWDLISFTTLLVVARVIGYRLVWTIHEIHPHESPHARQDMLASRALARLCHVLIAHDAATAERARATLGLPETAIHVVPHGSYIGEYPAGRARDSKRAEMGIPMDAFVFIAFGHMRGYKELPLLIEAFASMPPGARLIVAGVPWDGGIRQAVAAAAEGDDRISLMFGPVPVERVAELFGAADAAVFPRGDGWTSGSLILAMSMGVPVIASRRDNYAALIGGESAGWLFEPGDVASLRACMLTAAADVAKTREKGEAALSFAREMSWSSAATMTAPLLAPIT